MVCASRMTECVLWTWEAQQCNPCWTKQPHPSSKGCFLKDVPKGLDAPVLLTLGQRFRLELLQQKVEMSFCLCSREGCIWAATSYPWGSSRRWALQRAGKHLQKSLPNMTLLVEPLWWTDRKPACDHRTPEGKTASKELSEMQLTWGGNHTAKMSCSHIILLPFNVSFLEDLHTVFHNGCIN